MTGAMEAASRMTARAIGRLSLVALAILIHASMADAACNSIPDRDLLFPAETLEAVTGTNGLGYRGAIGRIDTPIARAAVPAKRGGFATEFITVGRDSACKSPRLSSGAASPSAREFVVLLMFPPGPAATATERTRVVVLADRELHVGIAAAAEAASTQVELLRLFSNDGVSIVAPDEEGGDIKLSIEYPDAAVLSEDGRTPITGPMRIVVTRAGAPIPFAKTANKCTDIAADNTFRPVVCIDELFFDGLDRCGTQAAHLHPGACSLVGGGRRNNFADQCLPGRGAGSHPASCGIDGGPTELDIIPVWPCGAVLLEFDWRDILNAGGTLAARRLSASTGVARSGLAGAEPLRIPGREFLASYRSKQHDGDSYKPEFIAVPQSAESQVQEFAGSADEPESTLFLYSRMPVGLVCDGGPRDGQACAGADDGATVCACDLGDDVACRCKAPSQAPLRYFSCSGSWDGLLDGMPCTRAKHCWVGRSKIGRCSGTPQCVAPGTVWSSEAEAPGRAEGAGRAVRNCYAPASCPDNLQCGYSLFDFYGRPDLPDRKVRFNLAAPTQQRGTCSKNSERACSAGAGVCSDRDGACIGYKLEAGARLEGASGGDPDFPSRLFLEKVPPGIVIGPEGLSDEDRGVLRESERSAREDELFY
jgi:hypothetical protein